MLSLKTLQKRHPVLFSSIGKLPGSIIAQIYLAIIGILLICTFLFLNWILSWFGYSDFFQ